MNISEATNAKKFGEFTLRDGHANKININYLSGITKNDLKDETPRVYLFVLDGVIKKIGGSAGKGGIKSTINLYVTSMTGSPGVPRFVLHLLIEEALLSGSKVELYVITSPKVLATINGLSSSKKVEIASFKEMEDFCKEEYFAKEGKYPDWNFQESHFPYPSEFAKKHNEYHKNRLKNKKYN